MDYNSIVDTEINNNLFVIYIYCDYIYYYITIIVVYSILVYKVPHLYS